MAAEVHRSADLLVVGGGPAGLATAIGARRAGLDVLLVDRGRPPIDRACGEGLMPDGVGLLHELGVRVAPDGRMPFRGIRYIDGDLTASAEFPDGVGLGIRRTHLHAALVERARELGVRLRWGAGARGLVDGGVDIGGQVLSARWLVAADGRSSLLRRWAGLGGSPPRRRRFGVRRHFSLEPWTDYVEVHWADRCEAYVTPVGRRRIGVALLWSGRSAGFDSLLDSFPALARRLGTAKAESEDRGGGPFGQRPRSVARGNLALVGDAAGSLDPISGEGVSLALHQAAALVDAITKGDLRSYEAAHRRLWRTPRVLTRLLLMIERSPTLRRRVIRSLAASDRLFEGLLAFGVRDRQPRLLGRDGVLSLAFEMARLGV